MPELNIDSHEHFDHDAGAAGSAPNDPVLKYSKTIKIDEDKVETTDIFKDFEPYYGGNIKAIPIDENIGFNFLNAGDNDRGYQGYDSSIVPGAIKITPGDDGAKWLTKNDSLFEGCRKGSVVKANTAPLDEWSKTGTYYIKYDLVDNILKITSEENTEPNISIDGTSNILRIGLVLVGCGGSCGEDKIISYTSSNRGNFNVKWPGGGGGGGATLWAILRVRDLQYNSAKQNYEWNCPLFKIILPAKPTKEQENGQAATVAVKIGDKWETILIAGGGQHGSKGSDTETTGGQGGDPSVAGDMWSLYCYYVNGIAGGWGAGYSYHDETVSADTVAGNSFDIQFLKDNNYILHKANAACNCYGNSKTIIDAKGDAWMAAPGGNSFGRGGYWAESSTISFYSPGIGGGGIGCANDKKSDPLSEFNFGGPSYFALFY